MPPPLRITGLVGQRGGNPFMPGLRIVELLIPLGAEIAQHQKSDPHLNDKSFPIASVHRSVAFTQTYRR